MRHPAAGPLRARRTVSRRSHWRSTTARAVVAATLFNEVMQAMVDWLDVVFGAVR